MALNIAVCVKPVPDPQKYNSITIDPVKKTLVRNGIPTVINPSDKNALEAALVIREKFGGKVVTISMAPPDTRDKLRECLAMGADEAYLLSDREFAGADTFATSYTLSMGLKALGSFDLILAGNESADGATSHVPSQLGEWMGLPHLMGIADLKMLDERRALAVKKIENGRMEFEISLPAVLAVTRDINKPRYISAMGIIKSKNRKLEVLSFGDIEPDRSFTGLKGSPTQPGEIRTPDIHRNCTQISGTPAEIADLLIEKLRSQGLGL
jgi:electron transfer flavoprotein beta subunit